MDAAVSGQPSADATRNSDRDVEGGRYRISVRSLLANRTFWSKIVLRHGSGCVQIQHDPPQTYLPVPAVPKLRPPAHPLPVRKPQ